MALIDCDECNAEISDRARSCPSCGAPQGGASEGVDTPRLFWGVVCAVGFFLPFFSYGELRVSGWEILKAIYTALASDQAPLIWEFLSRAFKQNAGAAVLLVFLVIGPVGFGAYAVSHIVHALNPRSDDGVGGASWAGAYVVALVIAAISFDIKMGDLFGKILGVGTYVSVVALSVASALGEDDEES